MAEGAEGAEGILSIKTNKKEFKYIYNNSFFNNLMAALRRGRGVYYNIFKNIHRGYMGMVK